MVGFSSTSLLKHRHLVRLFMICIIFIFRHNDASDDGIFTPFVNRVKRSSSNDSFSEAETETKRKFKTKKSRFSKSEDSSDSDDLVVSKKYTLFPSSSSESEKEPSIKSRITGSEIREKIIVSSEESDNIIKKFSPTIRRKKTVSGAKNLKNVTPVNGKKESKASSVAESSTDNEKTNNSCSPNFTPINKAKDKKVLTPITFKLKNIHKFTPPPIRVDDKENPSLFLRSLSSK